ncbi:hypothetical protein BDB01DRAFT_717199 [Pilobolus umbonatus]|nr:hypothetical protein BDB01DRAFT_717199 [Pilobolus umbonatus]
MKKMGLDWTINEYNEYFIAKMYHAQYDDVLAMFNELQQSTLKLSVGSFNVILGTYIVTGKNEEAIELIQQAQKKWGIYPDISDFERVMRRCMPGNKSIIETARSLMIQYNLSHNSDSLKSNIIQLLKQKKLEDIKVILEKAKQDGKKNVLDLPVYGALIKGFLDARKLHDAKLIYKEMQSNGLKPDINICVTMLSLYSHNRDVQAAEEVVRQTVRGGHKPDESIYNQLIKVYLKCRLPHKAFKAFEEIQKDPTLKINDIILNTMINGLVINNEMNAANSLYQQMLNSPFKPDLVTYNTMLKGYTKIDDLKSATQIMADMFRNKMQPDTVTFTTLINTIFRTRTPNTAEDMMKIVNTLGMTPNVFTYNAIINEWIRANRLEEAEKTLHLMKSQNIRPTIHTFTNLIQGYIENMNLKKAMETFQILLRNGIQPDTATFNFMIVGFIDHNRLADAFSCLQRMKMANISPSKDSWKLVLDQCIKEKNWDIGKSFSFSLIMLSSLITLPNELLIYTLRNFLDLADLWSLLQTNSKLRYFAATVIYNTWKIDLKAPSDKNINIQSRAILISLEILATQLSFEHDSHPTMKPYIIESILIKSLVLKEEKLHSRVIEGISSYKHKYVLIEDIDIRNRIRTTVDVIFHHAVFVSAISRRRTTAHVACTTTHTNVNYRALAAVMVRLLTRLDAAFPSYCREITYTLADNIKAFLEYTGYKLLAMRKENGRGAIKIPPSLTLTLQSIAACFDLIGAAFIGKLLTDDHVERAIQRTCELLNHSKHHGSDIFITFKRKILVDIMNNWLNIKREMGSSEICRFIRAEIDKCDQHQRKVGLLVEHLLVT